MSIDNITNGIQIVVLLFCVIAACIQAFSFKTRAWTLLLFFLGSWWMGDLYWAFNLLFYDAMPNIAVVSDLNWCASYLFLYLLLRETAQPDEKIRLLPFIGPVFAVAMAVFYMQWGEIVINLVYAAFMGLLMFASIRRFLDQERYGRQHFLSALILVFCLLEYGLWTASCFWQEESMTEPYYWFDLMLTASFPFFLPATKKAVAE